jgi:hypothetical protein
MEAPTKRIQFEDDGETRLKLVRYAKRHHLPRSRVYAMACRLGADILAYASNIETIAEKEDQQK